MKLHGQINSEPARFDSLRRSMHRMDERTLHKNHSTRSPYAIIERNNSLKSRPNNLLSNLEKRYGTAGIQNI